MPPHSIGSGTISFGLVKGYEFAKDQYVRFTDEELKALEGEASKVIDIAEFVPLATVDPIFFEKTYYLGPDKGGEKPYRLLADAMAKSDKVALATFVMRGKESLVLVRPAQDGLMLHTMYFADEVRDFGEIEKGKSVKLRDGELELAERLIGELSHDEFKPEQYQDEYRNRVLEVVNSKVEGKEITAAALLAPVRGPGGRLRWSFQDLLLLKTTRGLLEARVPPRRIRRMLASLRRQLPGDQALSSVSIYADGRRAIAWDGTARWQPDSGQFLFSFDARAVAIPDAPSKTPPAAATPP